MSNYFSTVFNTAYSEVYLFLSIIDFVLHINIVNSSKFTLNGEISLKAK